jgi:hypothetical protein
MEILNESTTGDFYDKNHDYNYYTAELYASLFFTRSNMRRNKYCSGTQRDVKSKKD